MQRNPLLRAFVLKTVLWFPPCLALWYWLAEWFNGPAAWLSGWIMRQVFAAWVEGAEWSHRIISLFTNLSIDPAASSASGHGAMMVLEANPLVYSYGLPMFAALVLAGGSAHKWRQMLLGWLFLIPFQAWGICFDLLKQVAIGSPQVIAARLGFDPWQREAIALAYQLGALVLPTLAPIVLWLALNRLFIPMLRMEAALKQDEKDDRST
jgi:hypothetical protein